MARGINRAILIGNLGSDPEVRYTQGGAAVTTISVATTESWKDKAGAAQERTEWHRVKLFGRLAEIAREDLKKGRQVYVEGSLRTEKYTDKAGNERYATEIIASELKALGPGRGEGLGAGHAGGDESKDRWPSSPRQAKPMPGAPSSRVPQGLSPSQEDDPFSDDKIPF
jgi:single-strand DNA-binding protein